MLFGAKPCFFRTQHHQQPLLKRHIRFCQMLIMSEKEYLQNIKFTGIKSYGLLLAKISHSMDFFPFFRSMCVCVCARLCWCILVHLCHFSRCISENKCFVSWKERKREINNFELICVCVCMCASVNSENQTSQWKHSKRVQKK